MNYSVSIIIILITFFLITLDVLFIPTFLLTLFALLGYLVYIIYLYFSISPSVAINSLVIFFTLGVIYVIIIFRLKLWEKFSFKSKLTKLNQDNSIIGKKIAKNSVDNDKIEAVTLTDLKPLGKILVNNKKYEALAVNGFIKKDIAVEIIEKSSYQFKVKPKNKLTN